MKPARTLFSLLLVLVILTGFMTYIKTISVKMTKHDQPIVLALMGDIMLGRGIAMVMSNSFDQAEKTTWTNTLSSLSPVLDADIAAANLESPLSDNREIPNRYEESDRYNLCAPSSAVTALKAGNINLVSIVNNHNLDCGSDGIYQTVNILKKSDIHSIQPHQTYTYNSDDKHLIFLAYDDVSTPIDLKETMQDIEKAYGNGKNYIIVSIHWGKEYQSTPTARQLTIAQSMANAGAVVIWGHHPHVIQPIEWIQGENKPFQTLVAYSLGNTLFDQAFPANLRQSSILKISIFNQSNVSFETIPIETTFPEYQVIVKMDK